MTREHISHISELIEILLSFQTGFNLANAVVVCAILCNRSGTHTKKDHGHSAKSARGSYT